MPNSFNIHTIAIVAIAKELMHLFHLLYHTYEMDVHEHGKETNKASSLNIFVVHYHIDAYTYHCPQTIQNNIETP
jgi:hypothetical protein